MTSGTCVLSFIDAPNARLPKFIAEERTAFVDWLLEAPWTSEGLPEYNVYTGPLALTTALSLSPEKHGHHKVVAAMHCLLEALEASRSGALAWSPGDPAVSSEDPATLGTRANGYLTYWAVRALERYLEAANGAQQAELKDGLERAEQTRTRAVAWAGEEVLRQLAFHEMEDYDQSEPFNLAYALAIHDRAQGRRGGRPNVRLLDAGLRALFEEQLPYGLWAKGLPKFRYSGGDVYPFAFEVLTAVMRIGGRPTPASTFEVSGELFMPYVPNLMRTLEWAESHELVGEKTTGWRSNWVPGAVPHAWSTAVVLSFADALGVVIRRIMSAQALQSFSARRITSHRGVEPIEESTWTRIQTQPALIAGETRRATATELIFEYILAPRINRTGGAAWSAIFYGPPGTAKTTLAEEIARVLEWPLVSVSTSDFLAEGADKMGYQARRVFRRLEAIDDAVVLIDEVEEFVKDREAPGIDSNDRLITTAMLTLLQDLRKRTNVILILATNHVERFDRAIRRPGRFDLVLFIAPPSVDSKLEALEGSVTLDRGVLDALRASDKTIERFNYLEWQAFVSALAKASRTDAAGILKLLKSRSELLTITASEWAKWRRLPHYVQVSSDGS